MSNRFERFDEIDARFAKLFAAAVLLLVVALVIADILTVAFGFRLGPQVPGGSPAGPAPASMCSVMWDGTRICDIPPPGQPN